MRNLLRLCALLVWGAVAVWAVDWKALHPQGYLSDFAQVVDEPSKRQLEAYGEIVERATGVQMAFVTIKSLQGEPIEDVANTIYRSFGVGQKGKNEGVLLLLSIDDHRSRIEVGYGLEPILPDGFVGGVLREMRPSLREAQFGEAMMAGAQEMGSAIAKAKGVTLNAHLPRRSRRTSSGGGGFPWVTVIIVVLVLLSMVLRGGGGGGGGFWLWMILGNLLGGGGGRSSGGGGFGGWDSGGGGGGGGFGGFGGGDSGGGGASSDW